MQPSTVLAFALSLVIQVAAPLAAVLVARRRGPIRWKPFAYGALVYGLFQLLSWLPLSVFLDVVVGARLSSPELSFVWLLALALGTAVVEEGSRWLAFRYLFPRGGLKLTWLHGLGFGLGYAAVETMFLIAGLTFIYLLAYLALHAFGLPDATLAASPAVTREFVRELETIMATDWTQPMVVAAERLMALPHQVAWTLLVMESLVSRQKRWFGFAVLYHLTVAVVVPGLARLLGFGIAELVNLGLCAVSVWLCSRLYRLSRDREV